MPRRPTIVLSLEAFSPSAVSCYGSSWNTTPAIDSLAANGVVWDRCVCEADDSAAVIDDWLARWHPEGRCELLTDDRDLIRRGGGEKFDEAVLVDSTSPESQRHGLPDEPASDITETGFARLIAETLRRIDSDPPWQTLWIHSHFLARHWDAPRSLFPLEESEFDDLEPLDETQWVGDEVSAEFGKPAATETPPAIFPDLTPPSIQLSEQTHPDTVTSWMRTYGCQIRLIDDVLGLLLDSVAALDPIVIVVGTSGFSLGQNGWIGYRVGPLRSCDISVPLIVGHGNPLRTSRLVSSRTLPELLQSLRSGPSTMLSAETWCERDGDEFSPRVVTRSDRAQHAVSTPRWLFVHDAEGEEQLFLKPDDGEDVNDVSRLSLDVIQALRPNQEGQ